MRTWQVSVNGGAGGNVAAPDAGRAVETWIEGHMHALEAGPVSGDAGGPYGSRRSVRFEEGEWWAELNLDYKGGDAGVHGWVIGDTFGIGGIDEPGGWYAGEYVDEFEEAA